jgi:23S rRNA (pseudouridine1915-N3)-methyltransferase
MRLLIVAVGERMPAWVDAAFAEYAKRMPRKARIELVEIKPERRGGSRSAAQCMSAEAARIQSVIPAGYRRIALDERGRDLSTAELAQMLGRWLGGGCDVALIIGGADGLDPALKSSAEAQLRLSSLTLPHALVRVLLAEQLYRAASILDYHPYHRA